MRLEFEEGDLEDYLIRVWFNADRVTEKDMVDA